MDFMVKSYKNNRGLLKGGKKSLKTIYNENSLHYRKKKVEERVKEFDPERKRLFLEKFHARQRKVQRRRIALFLTLSAIFGLVLYFILQAA